MTASKPAGKTNVQRQAEFKERMRAAGKRQVTLWLDADQEQAVKRVLAGDNGLDRATLDVIADAQREAAKWKAEALKLREAVERLQPKG